mgnify:CR=1 FL=1
MKPQYLIFLFLFILLYMMYRTRRAVVARKTIQNRRKEGKIDMMELAKHFLDKECLIYSFDSNHQYQGVIKEVSNSAVLIENGGTFEAINLDFVIRIREFPKNKKGKKKSVVLD